ncbi:MAG: class I SAM-dependent methyltransferase [Chloroflexi bacterium]|nr:class I SAM-dependent methyltransferase [Chloroflexota bacterium]
MNFKSILAMVRTPHLAVQGQLRNDLQAYVRVNFLYAAFEAGLLAALKTPLTLSELVSQLQPKQPELLESLLRVGVMLGEVAQENERYSLRGNRSRALVADDGDAIAAFVQEYVSYHGSVYRHLPERLQTGELGNYLQGTGNLIARSSRLLESFVAVFVQEVIRAAQPKRMLEIGCGSGVYLHYAVQASPLLTGIAIDMQADVIEQTKRNLQQWGVDNRFELMVANVLNPPANIAGPFDLVTLYNNIYYFPVAERVPLFKKIRAWLKPGGAFALVTLMRGNNVDSANFDLILQSTQGCYALPTLDELTAQLRESGFSVDMQAQLVPMELYYGVLGKLV